MSQCQKPRGWAGRLILKNMNKRHSKLTDWGLEHISIAKGDTILDVGCGGGRTVGKLALAADEGKVYGVDFSEASVLMATLTNRQLVDGDRVEICEASVSQLPFPEGMFNLVTAVETHFWWDDLPGGMREILRVLKPGGRLAVIAEVYKGADALTSKLAEKYAAASGMKLLSLDEHRDLIASAGYSEIDISSDPKKGWMCAMAQKP